MGMYRRPCVFGSAPVYRDVSTDIMLTSSIDLAYDRAFEEHWHDVFRFALSWTNDWTAAEDLAQDAYLRLWKGRKDVDWDRPVIGWLLVTTRRLATDRFRGLRRRLVRGAVPATLDEAVWDRWLDVRSAMAGLSPLERSALVLTALEGHPYADAAEIVGTSAAALRAAVSRARDKLEIAR